uniref:Uncharacterized protein n=1 Tax=Ignisphaera aggregans TaxID=334771 RepID=A0A7C4BCV7_9CREN
MERFILYPNYVTEEVGGNQALVTRSDGVKIKRIDWTSKAILIELANYPEDLVEAQRVASRYTSEIRITENSNIRPERRQ